MKRLNIFCSSTSSTAICSSLEHTSSMVRRRADRLMNNSKTYVSCNSSSQTLPIHHPNRVYRKSCSSSSSVRRKNDESSDQYLRRKSSADDVNDKIPYIDWISHDSVQCSPLIINHSTYQHSNYMPTPRSYSSSSDQSAATGHSTRANSKSSNHSLVLESSSSARSRDQVVVLWVSIHCKGCEGKVRKHISKLEGVRSVSIDLAAKKVTVVGNVTPLGVLSTLSNVKNAQLWPFPL